MSIPASKAAQNSIKVSYPGLLEPGDLVGQQRLGGGQRRAVGGRKVDQPAQQLEELVRVARVLLALHRILKQQHTSKSRNQSNNVAQNDDKRFHRFRFV